MPKPPADEGKTFTLEDLEKARQDERDKLYPQISKTDERTKAMQDELKSLRDFQKKAEKEAADRDKAVADAAKAKEEAELSAKELVEKRNAEWENKFQAMQQQTEQERALFAKEREFNQMQMYVRDRVAQESDSIAPQFLDYITGNTPEEIDASIERAKTKTQEILEGLQAAQEQARAGQTGVRSGPPAITPLDAPGSKELSADDIKGMSWQDFAKLRTQMGMGNQSGGLFG